MGLVAPKTSLDSFDYACLHSPYNKLVQKGFARLLNADLIAEPGRAEWADDTEAQQWAQVPAAQSLAGKLLSPSSTASSARQSKSSDAIFDIRRLRHIMKLSILGSRKEKTCSRMSSVRRHMSAPRRSEPSLVADICAGGG